MPKEREWLEDLIVLGIGAAAVYFLAKLITSDQNSPKRINICPYCGHRIGKWAAQCPNCRMRLPGMSAR